MTGYQEVLTDPSYAGQIVTMTCPQIGNYGVAAEDGESRGPQVAGFVVREISPIASNWRSTGTLREHLIEHGVVAITGIDTRALTRVLRTAGVMRGVIGTGHVDPEELVAEAQQVAPMEGSDQDAREEEHRALACEGHRGRPGGGLERPGSAPEAPGCGQSSRHRGTIQAHLSRVRPIVRCQSSRGSLHAKQVGILRSAR